MGLPENGLFFSAKNSIHSFSQTKRKMEKVAPGLCVPGPRSTVCLPSQGLDLLSDCASLSHPGTKCLKVSLFFCKK